jgi:hypothetical protein
MAAPKRANAAERTIESGSAELEAVLRRRKARRDNWTRQEPFAPSKKVTMCYCKRRARLLASRELDRC